MQTHIEFLGNLERALEGGNYTQKMTALQVRAISQMLTSLSATVGRYGETLEHIARQSPGDPVFLARRALGLPMPEDITKFDRTGKPMRGAGHVFNKLTG